MSGRERQAGLRAGRLAVVAAAGAGLLFLVPLLGLVARAPWGSFAGLARDPAVRAALVLSLGTSVAAAGLAAVVGTPLAWLLARRDFRGRRLLRGLVLLPMVLPPVVAGVALLSAFGRFGLLGRPLAALGIALPFTAVGAVLAQTFVAAPFFVVVAEAGFASVDGRLEDAAATLGASPARTFLRVVLPGAGSALGAAAALAWARALGEFGATITFAGSLSGRTQTLPLLVYELLQRDPSSAVALALVLFAISLAVFVALRGRLGLR